MDNQQDQPGTSNPSTPGRTPQSSSAAAAAGTDRTASASTTPGSQNPLGTPVADNSHGSAGSPPDATAQTTANAGADRQGEGQQTNGEADTLPDTALNSGKKWIEDSGVLNRVNQLPQTLKDFGNRAVSRVGDLTTTQKVVGGALLAAGLGWLAIRKGKSSASDSASGGFNYGKQRDAGSYGRRSSGYQAPDASASHRPATGAAGRSDSGSPYSNSGSQYGGSGQASGSTSTSGAAGTSSGSGRTDGGSGFGTAPSNDYSSRTADSGSRTAESSHRKGDDFRSSE